MKPALIATCLAALLVVVALQGNVARADLSLQAAFATINVDGDDSDWASIPGLEITLKQFEIPPGSDWEYDPVDPIPSTVKVAVDDENLYLLFEVDDDYDFDPADNNLSASPSVMFLIDPSAGPHMGAGVEDLERSQGIVDLWHWRLDCGPGEIAGGGLPGSGDDPDCDLDDEFSIDPEDREDDGDGDVENPNGENSIAGTWEHTNRAGGPGAAGTWIFEFSRPLQTGDPEDAQFALGGTALMALAYFDADESLTGWSDAGHLTSADEGWIEILLPSGEPEPTPAGTPTETPAPTATPEATATPAAPEPSDSDVDAQVTISDAPRVGDVAEVGVVLRSTVDGSPVVGTRVRVFREASFADVTGMVEVAGGTTDQNGEVKMTYIPRRAGDQELVIEYEMPDATEPGSTTATLSVADGGQVIRSDAGLDVPGLGVGLLMAVIAGVWLVLIILCIGVVQIARASAEGPDDGDESTQGSQSGPFGESGPLGDS